MPKLEKQGFNNQKYFKAQLNTIKKRAKHFDRIYLEIGGRLTYDGHASRVLPGYDPKNKVEILKLLKNEAEVLYCISSHELQKGTKWSNTGLTLDKLALKEIHELENDGIKVHGVVATRFSGEKKVLEFKKTLEEEGKNLYTTYNIKGYPYEMHEIFNKHGFNAQPYIPATRKIIIVTGAGANSGKMFVCLSQIFHEDKRGLNSGFAKWETFPIWNLPLNHEINIAYEAATADIQDYNMIDPFHKKKYGIEAVNYNRDVENFYILKKIITRIAKPRNYMHKYASPTDMGMNMAKKGITNDKQCRKAAQEEIIRRKKFYEKELKGEQKQKTLKRMEEIFKSAKINA